MIDGYCLSHPAASEMSLKVARIDWKKGLLWADLSDCWTIGGKPVCFRFKKFEKDWGTAWSLILGPLSIKIGVIRKS